MLLNQLSILKRRLLQFNNQIDNNFLINFFEAFNSLSHNLEIDSVERRLLFFILEQLIRDKWQENNFQSFMLDPVIQKISSTFLDLIENIQFCED